MNTSRIVEMAKEQGKTQAYLCRLLGKSRTYFKDISLGRYGLSKEALKLIATDLRTTPEYLNWETDDPTPPNDNAVKIPVLGEVAAGLPIDAVENIIDWEEISAEMARSGEYFGLVVKGMSMLPRMVEGDVLIVRKQDVCDNGQLAIVAVNGDTATCKNVFFENGGMRLEAWNPLFPDQVYTKEAVEQLPIRVLGVVVELRAKF